MSKGCTIQVEISSLNKTHKVATHKESINDVNLSNLNLAALADL